MFKIVKNLYTQKICNIFSYKDYDDDDDDDVFIDLQQCTNCNEMNVQFSLCSMCSYIYIYMLEQRTR